jgi:poly-gamma-glutamate capsule biosynthesis protein CapA/YwtB (metallophosphatase superfamily)
MSRRTLVALVGTLVFVAGAGAVWFFTHPSVDITGRVVNLAGEPLTGVSVRYSAGGTTTTGADGRFDVPSRVGGGWITAVAVGYLSRTRAAQAGDETLIRLSVDDGETVRLLFGGDVMFGRRFYDANDDGNRVDGLLRLGATADEHRRLLDGVAPLMADADLTIVNMETPLIPQPWADPREARPSRFQGTKEFVFGSAPEAAQALRDAGVDIVGLGNNHLYDALDAGVASTRAALLDAGYATTDFVGAGANVDEAWRPAIREVRGQRIAVVACTTITGVEQPVSYVAGSDKGGAAACDAEALTAAITMARASADLVIAMIHGGFEYVREPAGAVVRFSEIANRAGADLVVDHHPHVVGGIAAVGGTLTAWTMGNLLFDQTVWPTFSSYVLRVDVRKGAVANAYLEPIMLRGYRPVGVVGADADWVSREALSLSDGNWVVDDGSLALVPPDAERSMAVDLPAVDPAAGPAPILDLAGACLDTLPDGALIGRDIVWTGDFEDETADDVAGAGELWNLVDPTPDRQLIPEAAARGELGVRLTRAGADSQDIVLTPLHRLLVRPGDPVTILVTIRATREAQASLQLSWYNDTIGPSQAQSVLALPATTDFQTMRVETRVPDNAIALEPYVRLAPPIGNRGWIDVDDMGVITWQIPSGRPACDYVRLASEASSGLLRASVTSLPGDPRIVAPQWVAGVTLSTEPEPALPPGPNDGGWGTTE